MTKEPRIDLVFFDGCPNATKARENITAAFEAIGLPADRAKWSEWDLLSEATPESLKSHGSPTVLVDGADVTGPSSGTEGVACRADGAPSVQAIVDMLRQHDLSGAAGG